jgi:hypothetical protein
MAWASLAIAILALVVASVSAFLNHRAVKQEAADRREGLDLLTRQVQSVVNRESRELRGAVTIVCAELLRAAELADAYHGRDLSIQDLMGALPRDAWEAHRQEVAGLLQEHPIWQDLLEAEDALDKTKARGADPPTSNHLRDVVARLSQEARAHPDG